ncbi:MAG TPA: hypothetical protein VNO50_09960 [Pyrinomonadaceae bacterium]|nr:hypothetical protein [Pyrinomonadaceae bacterium]
MRQKVNAERSQEFMQALGNAVVGFVEPHRLMEFFSQIEDKIYKYPALNSQKFRAAVERVVGETERG